eukprot:m.138872 g.138872  ORF g.138872 m.138872 type:complete len:430 (-) comp30020_c0_seq1:302-1591(-)
MMKLTYFDGYGRADPIRLSMLIGQIEFEDDRIDVAEWPKLKASGSLPLGQLPILRVGLQTFVQSSAQLRYVGRLANMYPTDTLDQLRVDEVLETVLEVLNRAPHSSDQKRKKELREEYTSTLMTTAFKYVDQRLSQSQTLYLVGAEPSIADVAIFSLCWLISSERFDFISTDFCDQFSHIKTLNERLSQLPIVARYFNIPPPSSTPTPTPTVAISVTEDVEIPEKWRIFDDDVAFGKKCPLGENLEFVTGESVSIGAGKPVVVVLWAHYAEGDYNVLVKMSEIMNRHSGVEAVAVSCDARKADVEAFSKKLGSARPEIGIPKLTVKIPLAYDVNGEFRKGLQQATGISGVGVSSVFLVDRAGVIVWREVFGQMFTPSHGQIESQIRRVKANEPLVSNGVKPVTLGVDDDDAESEQDPDGASEDSDGLMF